MRRYMAAVPALCTFGPLEMVVGYATPYHVVSMIASLITAVGILIIFANVMQLIKEATPTEVSAVAATAGANTKLVVLGVVGAVLIAAAGFYLIQPTVLR